MMPLNPCIKCIFFFARIQKRGICYTNQGKDLSE